MAHTDVTWDMWSNITKLQCNELIRKVCDYLPLYKIHEIGRHHDTNIHWKHSLKSIA